MALSYDDRHVTHATLSFPWRFAGIKFPTLILVKDAGGKVMTPWAREVYERRRMRGGAGTP
jgi:hypothetical protein